MRCTHWSPTAFEYKYILRDGNVSSAAGMIERAVRIILII